MKRNTATFSNLHLQIILLNIKKHAVITTPQLPNYNILAPKIQNASNCLEFNFAQLENKMPTAP